MFTQIYKMLNSQEWYNTAPEIEILKGEFAKINDWRDVVNKKIRKAKIKYNK